MTRFPFHKNFMLECSFCACVILADLLHRQSYPCATHKGIWGSGRTDESITILGTT